MTDCTFEATGTTKQHFGLWTKFVKSLSRRAQRRADRIAFKHMVGLSPHILKDIGVTRGDITWAANLPIEKNAAAELEKVVRKK